MKYRLKKDYITTTGVIIKKGSETEYIPNSYVINDVAFGTEFVETNTEFFEPIQDNILDEVIEYLENIEQGKHAIVDTTNIVSKIDKLKQLKEELKEDKKTIESLKERLCLEDHTREIINNMYIMNNL